MIQIEEAKLQQLIVHRIGGENNENILSDRVIGFTEDQFTLIKKVLLRPFTTHTYTFEFTHEIDLEYNVLFSLSRELDGGADFVPNSQQIAQHLIAMSKHPNIKDGDLFIANYADVKFNGTNYNALGIYKFEDKESYIDTSIDDNELNFSIRKGLSSKKPDKAILILFTDEPYTLFVIDNGTSETDYWQNDFIKHKTKDDFVTNTTDFLTLTNEFIKEKFPQEFEVSKVDQIDLMNRSADYFKNHDFFVQSEFEEKVLGDPQLVSTFQDFDTQFREQNDMNIAESFKIAPQAVKKQNKNFKGIIKLDKNFHIYVHGDRQYIEQGVDEDGRKFYKLYYEEEL